jgi:hypothetical protein
MNNFLFFLLISQKSYASTQLLIYIIYIIPGFCGFLFDDTRVQTQDVFPFYRQEFYYLSHILSPFCFHYFLAKFSYFHTGPALAYDRRPPIPYSWDQSHALLYPICFLRWNFTKFLARLALNHDPLAMSPK